MLDFILGLYLAGLLVRGWLRGLVREAFDLLGLVAGTLIAFRLSAPVGDFLTQSFGVTPEAARIGAGIALFLLFGIALSVAAGLVTKVMSLPGLNKVNRVGGAGLAMAWGVVLLVVAVNVGRALPLPEDWGSRIEASVVVEKIAGPEALPQRLFVRVAGDTALGALHSIQDLFGTSRIVPQGDEVIEIPPAAPDEVRQVRGEATVILDELNRVRAGEGLDPVIESAGLVGLAETRALDAYLNGGLSRDGDCVAEAEASGGLSLARCADVVALAATSLGGFDGMLDSDDGQVVLTDPAFDRAGIAVVGGPTGRLLVIVLAA